MRNGPQQFSSNNIKTFSYYNAVNGYEYSIKTIAKVEGLNTTYFEVDEDYVYFYKTLPFGQTIKFSYFKPVF